MVCAEGCETAEVQSDDEVHTSQVPERSEGKTKVIKQQYPAVHGIETLLRCHSICCFLNLQLQQFLPFTVLKRAIVGTNYCCISVATAPTIYGMNRRML